MKLSLLAFPLLLTAAFATPARAETTVAQFKYTSVEAHFRTVNGCITTQLDIFGSTNAIKTTGNNTSTDAFAIGTVAVFDDAANGDGCGTNLNYFLATLDFPAGALSIDFPHGTARLQGSATYTDQGSGNVYTYDADITWTAIGTPTTKSYHSRIDFGDYIETVSGPRTDKLATAAGTLIQNGTTNLTPTATSDALLVKLGQTAVDTISKK